MEKIGGVSEGLSRGDDLVVITGIACQRVNEDFMLFCGNGLLDGPIKGAWGFADQYIRFTIDVCAKTKQR